MPHAPKALRRASALLLSFIIAFPANAALIVRPGPTALGPSAVAGASVSVAQFMPEWTASFNSFLTSPNPDPAAVRAIARTLASLNLDDATVKAQLKPLVIALRRAVHPILAKPIPLQATEGQLEDVDTRLEVLNYPAVRALLTEEQQNGVGAASWAFNRHLWEPTGDEWIRKKQSLDETIEKIRRELETPRAEEKRGVAPAQGAGPDVTVEVLQGDITGVKSDAVLTTVQEKHLCAGGVNHVINQANGCFAAALAKGPDLKDGDVHLIKSDGKGPIENVLFVADKYERPISDVVYDGLKAADAKGLESVSVPALRTGSVFGAVERSYNEITGGIRDGVERFLAQSRAHLKRISFVVYNDEKLATKLQNVFTEKTERERSLRTDLREAKLGGEGYVLTPGEAAAPNRNAPIYLSLLKPWDLKHLLISHKPVKIGEVEDKAAFSGPVTSVLNMPIKMPDSDIRVPKELAQFREFLQKVIDHEKAVNPKMSEFYMYLTVDQNAVKKGNTHRRPGVHIDGVQGARYKVKIPPEHLYSASDRLGTVFYDQTFDLTQLDPAKQHVHAELERQADEANARATPDFDIAFWDSYSVHRADVAKEDFVRTFIRVEFSMKQYDSEGDTHNPLFDYDWHPIARPIPATLDDKPAAVEFGATVEAGPLRAALRRLKAYGRGIWNQFWWNVGPPLKDVWRGYRAQLELAEAEGRSPAVRNPRAFFRGLRLLGTTGRITSSAGFAAGDAVILAEARALFARHVDADEEEREAFEAFLERAVAYNPGKRRTKTRSMIAHYMREGSVLPKAELAAYYDGLAKDADALADTRMKKDDVMADFKKTVDRLVLEANKTAVVGRRVLGALVFGSYANGAIRPGSDIDLQFITEDGEAPETDLPAALAREWAKVSPIPLEIISFTYVPPDAALLTRIHPEPILVVSPYSDVERRFTRDLPVPLPVPAKNVSPGGRLVRAALDLWMRFLLGSADLADALKPRAAPERLGYEDALDGIGPGVPHTIKDVKRYVLENLGPDAVAAKDDASVGYYIVEGDRGEARHALRDRGWTLGAPLEKEVGFHQVLKATTPDGKPALVILRVNGADRMIHMRSFLKLLGVPGERVHSLPGFRSWKKEYRAAFEKEGYVPDEVVYGMSDSATASLLALDPAATVFDRPVGGPGADVRGLPMTIVTLSDGRKVWIFKALYGRLAGDLMEALLEHGARRVTALGAAGALGAESRVGDWYTPATLESRGRRVDLSFIKEVPGIPRVGVQLHVATPNGGTKAWLEAASKSGVGFVDSELESINGAFAKHPGAELRLAQVVTEVMSGPNRVDLTETEMDSPERAAWVGKIIASSLGLSLPFSTGYDTALAGVAPGVKHTLKDLKRYIAESVPQGVIDAMAMPGVHFYIVEGDGAEARAKLEAHGWTLGTPLPRKEGFRQFYPATSPEGKRAIVALHVNGGDRVIHIQSYLKLLGVPGERVHTLRGYRSWKKEYAATFHALGYVPDGVVYGLPWTVVHRLLARDLSTDYAALKDFRREFNPAPTGIPENDLAFRPMKVLELADGRRYWFFMHLYGEQAGDLMAALREHGVGAATVLGSAGSLDPASQVGDWITGVPAEDAYLHVPSPSVETEAWRAAAERAGAKFVEVELKHILKEAGPGFIVNPAYVVSDVLSGPHHTDVTETVIESIPGMAERVDRIVGEALGLKGPLKIKSVRNVPFRKP